MRRAKFIMALLMAVSVCVTAGVVVANVVLDCVQMKREDQVYRY